MQEINLSEALVITVVSMVVVFLVLILIAYAIGILKNFQQKNKKDTVDVSGEVESTEVAEEKTNASEDEEALVAVIAAVVAATMELDVPDIKIKKIRRIDHSVWNDTARIEQMN